MRVSPALLGLVSLMGLSGCDFWKEPERVTLPKGGARLSSSNGSIGFQVYRYAIPGLQPSSVAPVDLFNRGKDDLAVADAGSSEVIVFRNQGDGTFALFGRFATCDGGGDVDGEDLDGDGY